MRHVTFRSRLFIYGALVTLMFSFGAYLAISSLPSPSLITSQTSSDQPKEASFSGAPLTTDVWGVFDPDTGEVLSGNDVTISKPIASLTKLFVALAVLESGEKDEAFSIAPSDIATDGRAGKLVEGEIVTPYTLLFPLLIESSNDAAVAIERSMGGAFYTHISSIVSSLNLRHTTIMEPSGLSAKNTSTVSDLARLFAYLREYHPHLVDITRLHTYLTQKTGYVNSNPASLLPTFEGGKNGFTDEAGKTFVGVFSTETGEDIGIVLLGSRDIVHDIQSLQGDRGAIQTASVIMSR